MIRGHSESSGISELTQLNERMSCKVTLWCYFSNDLVKGYVRVLECFGNNASSGLYKILECRIRVNRNMNCVCVHKEAHNACDFRQRAIGIHHAQCSLFFAVQAIYKRPKGSEENHIQ